MCRYQGGDDIVDDKLLRSSNRDPVRRTGRAGNSVHSVGRVCGGYSTGSHGAGVESALAVAVADAGGVGTITALGIPVAQLDAMLADMA
jgi:hypothetical protein